MSLIFIYVMIAAAGIALLLLARLLRSYPVVFFGLVFIVAAGLLTMKYEHQPILGMYWIGFALLSVLFSGLWLYKNLRWAFWFALGSEVGLLVASFFQFPMTEDVQKVLDYSGKDADMLAKQSELSQRMLVCIIVPILVFVVIGVFGHIIFNIIVPRLRHQNMNERKHKTNIDPIIGTRVTIAIDKEDGRAQRGFIGDIDWFIEPLYAYESFKVGDVVKVVQIKGVTLLCTRDGKDYRKEMKEKREQEIQKRRIEDEKLRARRAAAKAARKLEEEKAKARREEEKAKREAELREVKNETKEQEAKQEAELQSVRDARKEAKAQRKHEEKMAKYASKQKLAEEKAQRKAEEKAAKQVAKEKFEKEPAKPA